MYAYFCWIFFGSETSFGELSSSWVDWEGIWGSEVPRLLFLKKHEKNKNPPKRKHFYVTSDSKYDQTKHTHGPTEVLWAPCELGLWDFGIEANSLLCSGGISPPGHVGNFDEILKRNMQAAAHYVYGLSGLGSSRAIDSRVEHQLGMPGSMVSAFIL